MDPPATAVAFSVFLGLDSVGLVSASSITPIPSDEEAAAIVAAVDALWPRPHAGAPPEPPRTLAWRFSGRWWQRDRMAASDRPWR